MLTPLQDLARVKYHTGLEVRLLQHEEVVRVVTQPTVAVVIVVTYEVRETARDLIFKRRGQKMMTWQLTDTGWQYMRKMEMIAWDQSYEPVIIVKYGRSNTPAEVRARRHYEQDCHRPGTATNPMDSYDRVLDGVSTEKMSRYW